MNRGRTGLQYGFTLMELLVVLIILSIVAASIGVKLTLDSSSVVRDEARRLALLLQSAQEQAVLEGKFYSIKFNHHGYKFLTLNDKGELEEIKNNSIFGHREFAEGIVLGNVLINEKLSSQADQGLLLTPVGTMPPITISLLYKENSWQVQSRPDGTVIAMPADA